MMQAVPLAALALRALETGCHGAAEAAIEYFDLLSSVPVAKRDPRLGRPIFVSMLPSLAQLASHPAGFTTWQECVEEDEDTFHSFRQSTYSLNLLPRYMLASSAPSALQYSPQAMHLMRYQVGMYGMAVDFYP